MRFLGNILAAIIGFFIAMFLIFIFFIAVGAAVGSDIGNTNEIEISPNSILELDLSTEIKDYSPKLGPLNELLNYGNESLALNTIINALENAKTDENIKGISIKTRSINAGLAQTKAIRDKIEDFKTSGKFVYAFNDLYSQKNYYISSVADSIFLTPLGAIDFKGLSTEILYFKDFEDKYGIKMEVIRHGKYKSAVEPFIQNKMSEANREQTTSFLKSIWSSIINNISESRNLSISQLNNIANNALGRNANLARENQLVDRIIYEDQYNNKLKKITDSEKLSTVSIEDYIASGKGKISKFSKNKIAVIYAQGEIVNGKGDVNKIGQEITNKAIEKATKNKSVKAIVLRVNSPGGSALVSENIWRALSLAKQEKPIVVSMGNYAASGGYYISCIADKIFAQPTTITGSIGVFGAIPNGYELSKRIGINAEQVSTNTNPGYSFFEPMSEKFYEVTKEGVEDVYKLFVNRVAQGRKMTFEQVNEIAQGRVWSGKEALQVGLVDELGNLQDAIVAAAEMAQIESYKIRNYPNYKNDFKEVFKNFPYGKINKDVILKETLGNQSYEMYSKINKMKNLKGVQARVPYVLNIK